MIIKSNKSKFDYVWAYSLTGSLFIISLLYVMNVILGIEDFSDKVSLPVYTIIPGTMVILSIWALTKNTNIQGLSRKSMIFLVMAFCCWFIAEQTWNLYEHVLDIDPYPSIADLFYLSAPIFMFLSLLVFLKSKKNSIPMKNIIFASLISMSILIPSVFFTIQSGTEDRPIEEVIIALTYPIVDSILLVPAIITILFVFSNKKNFFWLMITSGIIILLAADSIFLFLVINNSYQDGNPVDVLWVASYTIWTFMMFYAIVQSNHAKKTTEYQEINKRNRTKKGEKYGVIIGLISINVSVAILLYGINYFIQPKQEAVFDFFSWILIMLVVIFSAIIILINSRLKNILQNRTLQLEQTKNELIKSERFSAIGELASRISHDIRNPLSNIVMSIELIKNSPSGTTIQDQGISEKLDTITKNIERISHQVNDVLGYVKDRKLIKQKFSLVSSIRETIETLNIPQNITIKIPKTDLTIIADPFQLQIVFNNIILNAMQSIGKDTGEITVRFFDKNQYIVIEIENSGPGIPEEILPHVFDSLLTTKQRGTGLGLVSCKTIVENHGGVISAKNNPTKFIIKIPKEGE